MKAVVPWKDLLTRGLEYINSEYLPPNVSLMDPSHLRAEVVKNILFYWYDRQAQGKPVLRFEHGHLDLGPSSPASWRPTTKPRRPGRRGKGEAGLRSDHRSAEDDDGFVTEHSDDDWGSVKYLISSKSQIHEP